MFGVDVINYLLCGGVSASVGRRLKLKLSNALLGNRYDTASIASYVCSA